MTSLFRRPPQELNRSLRGRFAPARIHDEVLPEIALARGLRNDEGDSQRIAAARILYTPVLNIMVYNDFL